MAAACVARGALLPLRPWRAESLCPRRHAPEELASSRLRTPSDAGQTNCVPRSVSADCAARDVLPPATACPFLLHPPPPPRPLSGPAHRVRSVLPPPPLASPSAGLGYPAASRGAGRRVPRGSVCACALSSHRARPRKPRCVCGLSCLFSPARRGEVRGLPDRCGGGTRGLCVRACMCDALCGQAGALYGLWECREPRRGDRCVLWLL